MYTETLTQRLGIAAAINPQTLNNSNKTTGAVDLSKFHRAIFIIEIGSVTNGGSITAQLIESASSSLSSPQNVGGSAGTLSGLTTANQQYTIEIRADELDAGYRYVGLKLTETGSQNVVVCAIALGDEASHKPGNAANDASVAQQNVV